MANTKMTNVLALSMAIEVLSSVEGFNPEALAKLENVKASYVKKSTNSERKPTQTQLDNERLKSQILGLMSADTLYTVTDIVKALPNEYSNQKISALMNALAKANKLAKSTEKGKTYFSLV